MKYLNVWHNLQLELAESLKQDKSSNNKKKIKSNVNDGYLLLKCSFCLSELCHENELNWFFFFDFHIYKRMGESDWDGIIELSIIVLYRDLYLF